MDEAVREAARRMEPSAEAPAAAAEEGERHEVDDTSSASEATSDGGGVVVDTSSASEDDCAAPEKGEHRLRARIAAAEAEKLACTERRDFLGAAALRDEVAALRSELGGQIAERAGLGAHCAGTHDPVRWPPPPP